MDAMTAPSPGWCVFALLVATQLVGCAARLTRGASTGLKWRVGELTTSERDATSPGYRKSGGRAKDYRYVVTLHFASWKMTPSVYREPESTRLTPWRTVAGTLGRPVACGEDHEFALLGGDRLAARLGARPLLDEQQIAPV